MQSVTDTASASPTSTDEPMPTFIPSFTPTTAVIDAGPATDTPASTASLPDSPLLLPTRSGESEETSTETRTPRPTAETADSTPTPTPTPTSSEDVPPASTSTLTPPPTSTTEPDGEEWSFENSWTYFDEEYQEFYVSGEMVNNSTSDLRITSFLPRIYDDEGHAISDQENVTFPWGFEWLMIVSVAPGQHLPFSFVIDRFDDVGLTPIEERYEILIEAEPAEPTRDDLEVFSDKDDYDMSEWPDYFYVLGTYTNPGPALEQYVAIVVTLYDEDGFVIGVGGQLETGSSYLESQEQYFEVGVEMWEATFDLDLHVVNFEVQLLAQ